MMSLFELEKKYHATIRFSLNHSFILFETMAATDSRRYFYQNKEGDVGCFIVGHICACGLKNPQLLSGVNLAQWVVARYKEGSWDFIRQLRGTFNIILFDKDSFFLVNDILGLSPMYTYPSKKGVFFCSEAEPILWAEKDCPVDAARLSEFLVYGFVPNGKTFVRGLESQREASVVKISRNGIERRSYGSLSPMKWENKPYGERLEMINDAFRESVRIRADHELLISDLTGGWDTRFVLAHLLSLGKKPFVFTTGGNDGSDPSNDRTLASRLARKFKLTHIIQETMLNEAYGREDATLRFNPRFSSFHAETIRKRTFNHPLKYLEKINFFTSPALGGLYGTELFGYVPHSFRDRRRLSVSVLSRKFLKKKFLNDAALKNDLARTEEIFLVLRNRYPNDILSFLTQIGHSYLYSLLRIGWERPRIRFNHYRLLPFVDSKFVAMISSLDENKYLNYKMYGDIFQKHFPDFLKIPWTHFGSYRKKSLPESQGRKAFFTLNFLRAHLKHDQGFRNFLNNNPWIQPTDFLIKERLKEIYFIFHWFQTNKSFLKTRDE
jgi:asparagine synthetase B (glutamine-hydrolysing)